MTKWDAPKQGSRRRTSAIFPKLNGRAFEDCEHRDYGEPGQYGSLNGIGVERLYELDEERRAIWREFIELEPEPDQLRGFVSRYGFLYPRIQRISASDPRWTEVTSGEIVTAEPVERWCYHLDRLKTLYQLWQILRSDTMKQMLQGTAPMPDRLEQHFRSIPNLRPSDFLASRLEYSENDRTRGPHLPLDSIALSGAEKTGNPRFSYAHGAYTKVLREAQREGLDIESAARKVLEFAVTDILAETCRIEGKGKYFELVPQNLLGWMYRWFHAEVVFGRRAPTYRGCIICGKPLGKNSRADKQTCSDNCRQALSRNRRRALARSQI